MEVHVALFAFPQQGHTTPMLQLALHLSSMGTFVTLINTQQAHQKLLHLHGLTSPRLRFASIPDPLPPVTLDADVIVSDNSHGSSAAMPALLRSLQNQGPALEKLLSDLNTNRDWPFVSCLISDAFLPWTRPVACKLQLSWMVFYLSSATRLFLTANALEDDSAGIGLPKSVPGLPVMTRNMSDLWFAPRNPQALKHLQARFEAIQKADCVLLNSFDEIENEAIRSLSLKLPIKPLGPLCLGAGADDWSQSLVTADKDSLEWLDKQTTQSVLYICFGSKAVLQGKPLEQLALGIEASNRPFLWVLRSREEDLPRGFLNRTKERSKIVSWVPQKKILEHNAVGAFFTHCGWNSVLEALVEGVPMICWPMFSDQPTSRILVEEKWRVGRGIQGEQVQASDIGQLIQDVMGDGDLRCRASVLSQAARSTMEQGGCSYQNLMALFSTP